MAVAAVLAAPAYVLVGPDRSGVPDTPSGDAPAARAPAASPRTPGHDAPATADGPPADTVLVFDDGRDGAVTVDFDEGVLARAVLPGQRPGERPFRLWRLDRRLVVGSDRIWAVRLGSDTSQQLGQATAFVPDAHPDRLWLVDHPGGSDGVDDGTGDGTVAPIWTLIDDTGAVLHRAVGRAGMVAVRGVPGGLALATEHGLKVYDVAARRIFFYVGAPHGWIGDVAGDRVAWCRPGCHRLTVTGAGHDPATVGADEILAFESGSVWLSPGGAHVAAVASAVAPGSTGPIRQVLVFDVDTGQVRSRQRLPAGDVHGSWSVDGRQFFYALPDGDRLALGRFRVGGTGFEVRAHPQLDALDGFVALPRTAVVG